MLKIKVLEQDIKLNIKNIICFYIGKGNLVTPLEELRNKKEEDWTYEDYLTDSCDRHNYNLVWFNKDTVSFIVENNTIKINDNLTKTYITLTKENIKDTLIFQGQANANISINYEGLFNVLENMGFIMLNTINEIKTASDKYLSSLYLSLNDIPQPKYCIVTHELFYNMPASSNTNVFTNKTFFELLDSVCDKNVNINKYKDDYEQQYVVKILDGSLGIGVFICNHSEIESILQALFSINKNTKFIIQEYKENTGDIRVHLLSVDGVNYEILACMKRNKISGDFRSNVSLGATTSKYKLNEEQEEIVKRVAKLSCCRWVGVDLMECEDGSNYVIEYNSSPGVQGISKQIGKNMFDIVFTKFNNFINKHFGKEYDNMTDNIDKADYSSDHYQRNNVYVEYSQDVVKNLKNEWKNLSQTRQNILEKCLSVTPGSFYRLHGKTKPEWGVDCSGFVKYIYKKVMDVKLPKMCAEYFTIYKDSVYEMIDESEVQPGDIGIIHETSIYNHCAIYAGDGKWFECCTIYGVSLTDYDKFNYFFRVKGIDE